ncbi:hypothetical protein ACFLZX_03885 [Nanoarchaeota archaeon]
MSLLDKLKFWKKEPTLDLGPEPDLGMGKGLDEKSPFDTTPGADLGAPPGSDLSTPPGHGLPPTGQTPPSFDESSSMSHQPFSPQQSTPPSREKPEIMEKSIEVVSIKIDALKATLDAVNQRLENLEHIAREEQRKRKGW